MNENVFDSANMEKLNNPLRKEWLPPSLIWEALGIQEPSVLVDYGAGTGFFTKALAPFARGAVIHALDILPEMVEYMQADSSEGIQPMLLEKTEIPLPGDSVDALWSITVYHELDQKKTFLQEALRVLKPGGVLLLIDWDKEDSRITAGPPLSHRTVLSQLLTDLEDEGFREITSHQGFNSHFCLRALKPQ